MDTPKPSLLASQVWLSPVLYCLPYLLPVVLVAGVHYWHNYWLVIWIAFAFIPFCDIMLPIDLHDPGSEKEAVWDPLWYKLPLYLWPPTITVSLLWALLQVQQGGLGWSQWIGLMLSLALQNGGLGITVAHELFHKNEFLDQFLAYWSLLLVSYMHFGPGRCVFNS
jgi:alkane 1-monooxygenase